MHINDLIKHAVNGRKLPACPPVSARERQHFDAWSRAGIIHGEEPPATLKSIIDSITARRGVTLYREVKQ